MTVSLTGLDRSFPLNYRYTLEDPALEASIQKLGVMIPLLIVQEEGRQLLLSGHKRLAAAEKAGLAEIPVQILEKKLTPKQQFLAAVISNWGQTPCDLDVMRASVLALRDFKFTEDEYTEELLPALGLAPQRNLIRDVLKTQALEKEVLDAVAAGQLPFKGAAQLLKFPPDDQRVFVREAAQKLRFSVSQLQETVECLYDMMRQSYRTLGELLKDSVFSRILQDEKSDPRQRTDAFMKILREKKNPRLSQMEKDFAGQAGQITSKLDGLSLEAPPYFENQGYFLKMHVRSAESLNQLQQLLAEERSSFNALLQGVL